MEPTDAAWVAHFQFLTRCEQAADEPRAPRAAEAQVGGGHVNRPVLVSMQSVAQGHRSSEAAGVVGYTDTLGDIFGDVPMPIDAVRLPSLRAQRIATLRQWLDLFPAQQWLARQQPVREAYESFQRVRQRSDCAPPLLSDLAELRFWRAAGLVAKACRGRRFSPDMLQPPDADQRKRAANAAKELLAIAKASTLLMNAGLSTSARDQMVAGLELIQGHAKVPRRKRMDAHEKERAFVRVATIIVKSEMRFASTAVVAALVRLFVLETGDEEIRKQIQSQKKLLEATARTGATSA